MVASPMSVWREKYYGRLICDASGLWLLAIGAISVSGSKVQIVACSQSLIGENGVIAVIYCQKPMEAAVFLSQCIQLLRAKKKCK